MLRTDNMSFNYKEQKFNSLEMKSIILKTYVTFCVNLTIHSFASFYLFNVSDLAS